MIDGDTLVEITVCSVLGEERVAKVNPGDGFPWFNCPFCSTAVYVGNVHPDLQQHLNVSKNSVCSHGWCVANPAMPLDAARLAVGTEHLRDMEEQRRARANQAAWERIEAERQGRAEQLALAAREAAQRGTCVRCAQITGRHIKHRNRCPKL